jgi:hypothetical protein
MSVLNVFSGAGISSVVYDGRSILGRNFPSTPVPRKIALSAYRHPMAPGSECSHTTNHNFFRRIGLMKSWFCLDCQTAVDLDTHGRCGSCESEAVAVVDMKRDLTSTVSMSNMSAEAAMASA